MKAALAYWIAGCILAGAAWGNYTKRCPNDELKLGELAEMAAIWPAAIVAVIAGPRSTPLKTCDRPASAVAVR